MSYGGRVHDALWESLQRSCPEIPWETRSLICELIGVHVLPIFEREIEHRAVRVALRQLEVAALEKLGIPPAR